MPIGINGSGTITGVSVGGLPDGIVDTDMLASKAATAPKLGDNTIVQVKYVAKTGTFSTASASGDGADVTGMSQSISLTSASNNTLVVVSLNPYLGGTSTVRYALKLFRDSTMIFEDTYVAFRENAPKAFRSSHIFLDTGVSDTNSHTYKVALKKESGSDTIYLFDEGANAHTITLMEIAA